MWVKILNSYTENNPALLFLPWSFLFMGLFDTVSHHMYEIRTVFHIASSLNNKNICWCLLPKASIWEASKLQGIKKLGEQRIYSDVKFNCLLFPYMHINHRGEAPVNRFAQVHNSIKSIVLTQRLVSTGAFKIEIWQNTEDCWNKCAINLTCISNTHNTRHNFFNLPCFPSLFIAHLNSLWKKKKKN